MNTAEEMSVNDFPLPPSIPSGTTQVPLIDDNFASNTMVTDDIFRDFLSSFPNYESPIQEKNTLNHWELPTGIIQVYKSMGIEQLYPWQVACLEIKEVTSGGENLVYCAPTSGGKTLVSEILLLRKVLLERKYGPFFILSFNL